jgi:predicted Rossmann fold nucleotide-binding protein DprA/Smf involved in DNA uptake
MLHPDTEAVLLLCGQFGRPQENGVSPLELQEFNYMAQWLEERTMHPAGLLDVSEMDLNDRRPPIPVVRLQALLQRGSALALAVESWESRGLWVLSQSDELYPSRLRQLGPKAPPILYGAGDCGLLSGEGQALAIVGSRQVDEPAEEFTWAISHMCGRQGIRVVSGAAKGVDSTAIWAALEAGGTAIGVLAASLARAAVAGGNPAALADGYMVFISPYDPNCGFNAGNAMGRNKYIYALADAALVVSAALGTGGTWAGAIEALKRGTTPVFVRVREPVPEGNMKLLEEGAHSFPDEPWEDLAGWLSSLQAPAEPDSSLVQGRLW